MRKLLLSVLFIGAIFIVKAQELEEVQEKISKGKFDEAKEKIDKILADEKNQKKANPWYYKGTVYAGLARMDSTNSLTYDAAQIAFDAFKKYQELDAKNILMTLDQNVGLFQLYDLHYNKGIKTYNKKDYEASYNAFKKALEVEGYVSKRGYVYSGFSFPLLDTQLVNLTATSAYLAKKEDEAIPYFETLANAGIKDKEYKEVYGLLAEYYLKKKDPKADKYLATGRQLFPDEDYWMGLEFGNVGDDKEKKMARYEELMQKYPDNYTLAVDYSIEMFNYTYSNEKKPADYADRQAKLKASLDKSLAIKPNSALANYVMSQHIYNEIYDLEDAQRLVKGTTAADLAKKKDFTTKLNAKYEELLTYSQKAYDLYIQEASTKTSDKANLRKAINQLIDYHQRKNQKDKVTMYQEKLKKL